MHHKHSELSICLLICCQSGSVGSGLTIHFRLWSPITLFTNFLVSSASLLDRFFGPECVDNWWNERIEEWLQEPLVDPQQDRNHNTGNAHHDCGSERPPKMMNLFRSQNTTVVTYCRCTQDISQVFWTLLRSLWNGLTHAQKLLPWSEPEVVS